MKHVLTALILFTMAAAAATAEDLENRANLSGMWVFVANIGNACTFTGQAVLTAEADGRNYACELTARQSCPDLGIEYLVRQSCVATRTGRQISVRARIEEFLEGPPSASYYPDNFSLFIQDSTRMNGALISGGPPRQAVWTRPEGGIS